MLYFLYGPDSYRSRKKLEEMVGRYKALRNGGLNFDMIDAAKTDFAEFSSLLNSNSMFAEKKLVVVKNLFGSKQFQELFLGAMKSFTAMADIVVVYESDAVDERTKIFKELRKTATCQECKALDAKQVRQWAQEEFGRLGQKINLDALDLLVRSTGSDLWRLAGEIQKLNAFRRRETIKKDDVTLLVKPKIETDIFKTIDALAAKDRRTAVELMQKHLETGESPLYLMSMIAYQFRNLLVIKELAQQGLMYDSIVRKSGLHPFVVRKNYAVCRQFAFEDLQRIYRSIFDLDSQIKSGLIDQETALTLLVSSI